METTRATPGLMDDRSRLFESFAAPPPAGDRAKPQAADNGHDARGRFAKGNKGGPGNPFARQVAKLRSVVLKVLDEEHMEALVRQVLDLAMQGNLAAAKFLITHALGKPAQTVDPDRLDLEEWQLQQEAAATIPQMRHVFFNTSAAQANSLAPIMVECAERRMEKGVREGPEAFVHELNDDEYAELADILDPASDFAAPPSASPSASRSTSPAPASSSPPPARAASPSRNRENGPEPRPEKPSRPSVNVEIGQEEIDALRAAIAGMTRADWEILQRSSAFEPPVEPCQPRHPTSG